MKDGFIKVSAITTEIKVADCVYNADKIVEDVKKANDQGVKLAVFAELCLTGSTCGDLFFQRALLTSVDIALTTIADKTKSFDIVFVVGAPIACGGNIFNSAVVFHKGDILGVVPSVYLPKGSRCFSANIDQFQSVTISGEKYPFGTDLIFSCIDMNEFSFGVETLEGLQSANQPSTYLASAGANIIVSQGAVAEKIGEAKYRAKLVEVQSARCKCGYVLACAGVGESTTDGVFGGQCLIAESGEILSENAMFEGKCAISDIDVFRCESERQKDDFQFDTAQNNILFDMKIQDDKLDRHFSSKPFEAKDEITLKNDCKQIIIMQAQGLKARLAHVKSSRVVVGVSGGLDSSLALIVAVKAMEMLGRSAKDVVAVTMPCFGTTKRTRSNAEILSVGLGVDFREIDITASVNQHFKDISHKPNVFDAAFENAQARERTQVLMDLSNQLNGFVVGTGDLSELALGWATYGGDHLSMYSVNSSIPKTLLKRVVEYYAEDCDNKEVATALLDIVNTPVSPELLPTNSDGEMTQKTETLVGPYELHDFFIYHALKNMYSPSKIYRIACLVFDKDYDKKTILTWLKTFYKRFFTQQFKRSCMADGVCVGSVSLSPRGGLQMPSDAVYACWLAELDKIKV